MKTIILLGVAFLSGCHSVEIRKEQVVEAAKIALDIYESNK
jgi:hypothetical protein